MVKNRFISLILRTKKKYPDIVEEEQVLEEISREMVLNLHDMPDPLQQRQKLRSTSKDQRVKEEESSPD